jgi:NADH dehydrogenase FAD-containing subunit
MLSTLFASLLAWLNWLVGVRTHKASELGRGQTVVIVGAGFGGVTLAHYLESATAFDIVLVDRKEFFEYTPAMLRVMRDPTHMNVSHARYADLPLLQRSGGRIRFVQDEIVEIGQHAVRGRSSPDQWIRFDKLVLAMGSDYPDHLKPEPCCHSLAERRAHVDAMHASLRSARRITLFGGGLVGVELAAELAEAFPRTSIIFRQRESVLLPGFPARAQRYVQRFFEKHANVTLVFNNSIPPSKYEAEGAAGEEIVFNCTGLKPVPLPVPASSAGVADQKRESKDESNDPGDGGRTDSGDGRPPPPSSRRRRGSASNSSKKKKGARAASPASPSSPASFSATSSADFAAAAPLSPWPLHARTGLLRVTPELHLAGGHANIFALGDVMIEEAFAAASAATAVGDGVPAVGNKTDEPARRAPKVAYEAELQAWCVAENIKRQAETELLLAQEGPQCKPRPEWRYPQDLVGGREKTTPTLVCCSLGRWDGVVIFNSLVVPGWPSVALKVALERSKMAQLRGYFLGELFWTVVEPMSLWQHRVYQTIAGWCGGNKNKKNANTPPSISAQ